MIAMRRLPFAAVSFAGAWQAAPAAAASLTLDRIKQKASITFAIARRRAVLVQGSWRPGPRKRRALHRAALAVQRELQLKELKIEWVPVDAATRFETVAGGKVDAECGTSTITLARMKTVDFSLPIFVDGGSVLVHAKSKLTRLKDLKGKRIAVISGTTTEQSLQRTLNAADAAATLVPVKDGAEGMAQLTQRKVDGYAGDRVVLAGQRMREKFPETFEFIGEDFSYEPTRSSCRATTPISGSP
jgi:ABC-type amino acid transport substrate-binding protein